jgi:SNF2 family DNA or RNA helicase
MKKLYPLQKSSKDLLVCALEKHRVALDTSDTGTGKTVKAVELARDLGKPAFVVCPKAVIPSWLAHFKEQGVNHVGVINYEKLRTGKTEYGSWGDRKLVFRWKLPTDSLIIWDECHKLKGKGTLNSKMGCSAKPYYNLLLSATAANSPVEMRALGFMLGLHKGRDYVAWAKQHGCGFDNWNNLYMKKTGADVHLEKIRKSIYPDKGDKITRSELSKHFTETQIITEPLDFDDQGKIQKMYDEMEDELADLEEASKDDSKCPAAAALVAQLRARQAVELLKVPYMSDLAKELMEEGNAVAMFVNFKATTEAICKRLPKLSIPTIEGGQSATVRQKNIDSFQNGDVDIIVVNLAAGGLGISLHDEHGTKPRAALISPSWNEKDLIQALGRVDRAGAQSDTLQRILFAAGTVEEKIETSLKNKLKSLDLLHKVDDSSERYKNTAK